MGIAVARDAGSSMHEANELVSLSLEVARVAGRGCDICVLIIMLRGAGAGHWQWQYNYIKWHYDVYPTNTFLGIIVGMLLCSGLEFVGCITKRLHEHLALVPHSSTRGLARI